MIDMLKHAEGSAVGNRSILVGTEDVLRGVCTFVREHPGTCVSAQVELAALGVTIEALSAAVAKHFPARPAGIMALGTVTHSEHLKRAIANARNKAKQLGHSEVHSLHLLWALCGLVACTAARMLAEAGVTSDKLEVALVKREGWKKAA
jgi:ATP-dependent Clp protease ATP-binding subunit ClpA